MKDEDKTKTELIKELKTLRKEGEKSRLNDIVEHAQFNEKFYSFVKNILNTSVIGIFILDANFKIVWINLATEKYFELQREKVIGKDKRKVIKESMQRMFENPDEFIRKIFEAYDNNTCIENFECHVLSDIKYKERWLKYWSQPIKSGLYAGGRIEYCYDITEYKQVEKKLRDLEESFKTSFNCTFDAHYLHGLKGNFIDGNLAEERIKHFNLVIHAIRNINQLIVKEKDRERLLKGVCDSVVETRGYYSSWIALLNEEGKIETYAEAGLGEAFSFMVDLLQEGKLTACIQKALKQKDIVIIEDPAYICADCPLAQKHFDQGIMTLRLEHNRKVYGVMSVSIPAHFINDKEEQALFKEIAEDLALGLHNIELGKKLSKQTHDLKERIKELNCLFQLSAFIEKPGISLEEIIQELVNFLPSAWQYPEITCAQIILENKKYRTANFKETIWKQSGDIKLHKKTIGTLEVYSLEARPEMDEGPFQKEKMNLIKVITERLGSFIDREKSVAQAQQSYQKLKKAMNATIETMSKIIEVKDPYTAGHQRRVSQLATAIAKELNLSQDKVKGIRIASLIHDIGKIGIPSEILSKPIKLTNIEFSLIKGHSQIGYDILKSIDFSYPVAQIVLQHHERLNGSGYPQGLKGDKILFESKILGVADVVEAMSSHRPYRPALGIDVALEEISQDKGIFYDPEVVDACLRLFKEKGFKFEYISDSN